MAATGATHGGPNNGQTVAEVVAEQQRMGAEQLWPHGGRAAAEWTRPDSNDRIAAGRVASG